MNREIELIEKGDFNKKIKFQLIFDTKYLIFWLGYFQRDKFNSIFTTDIKYVK